jgi:hypothetical protein
VTAPGRPKKPFSHHSKQAEIDNGHDQLRQLVTSLHTFVDLVDTVRSRRIRGLGALVLLNLADLVTTVWFLALGGEEGNPVLESVIQNWWLVMIIKALVMACIGRWVLAASPRSREAKWMVDLAIAYYTMIVTWNLYIITQL